MYKNYYNYSQFLQTITIICVKKEIVNCQKNIICTKFIILKRIVHLIRENL